ncbi:hypothetical protein V3C99_008876 [Haemonchus contortus]
MKGGLQQDQSDTREKTDENRHGSPRSQNMQLGFARCGPKASINGNRSRSHSSSQNFRPVSPRYQSEAPTQTKDSRLTSLESVVNSNESLDKRPGQDKADTREKTNENRHGSPRSQNMQLGFARCGPKASINGNRSRSHSSSQNFRPVSPRYQSEAPTQTKDSRLTSLESVVNSNESLDKRPGQDKADTREKTNENRHGSHRSQNMQLGFARCRPKTSINGNRSRPHSSSQNSRPVSSQNQSEALTQTKDSRHTSLEPVISHQGFTRDLMDRRVNAVNSNESLDKTPEAKERWDSESIMELKKPGGSTENVYTAESGESPQDRCWIVWLIIMLHGIGVLIPWNMLVTIAPQYYVDYWFTTNGRKTILAKGFMSTLGITCQVPNFLTGMLNLAQTVGGSLMLRGTLFINCVIVAIIIALVVFLDPTEEAMIWFYSGFWAIVVILNGSNGLYQNSVFRLTADFPAAYTNAIVVGNNICGIFISILSIATNLAFMTDKSVAVSYFSIVLAVLILCIISFFYLTHVEFYKYYVNKGRQARIAEHAKRPSLRQYSETFKYCFMQLLSVFLVFFVTLAVFPTVLAGTTPNRRDEPWNSAIPKDIYLGLTVFLNFNLLAAIGSTTANFVQIPGPDNIIIPVLLRLLFIPYFMLCNYNVEDRVMPVVFKNQWFFIIGNAVMAFTSGYFSSLALMVVPSSLTKTARLEAGASLVTGVLCGVSFVPAITYMVNNFNIEELTVSEETYKNYMGSYVYFFVKELKLFQQN